MQQSHAPRAMHLQSAWHVLFDQLLRSLRLQRTADMLASEICHICRNLLLTLTLRRFGTFARFFYAPSQPTIKSRSRIRKNSGIVHVQPLPEAAKSRKSGDFRFRSFFGDDLPGSFVLYRFTLSYIYGFLQQAGNS